MKLQEMKQDIKNIFSRCKKIFYVATPVVLIFTVVTTMVFRVPNAYAAPPKNFKLLSMVPDGTSYDGTLSWDPLSGATGYGIYASTTSGSGYVPVVPTSNPTPTSATFKNIPPGVYYDVLTVFTGSNPPSQSAPTPEITVITPPANFKVGTMVPNGANQDVTLSWDAVPGVDSYTIWASTTSGTGYLPVPPTSNPTPTSATFANTPPGTYYDVITGNKGNIISFGSGEIKVVVPTSTPSLADADSDGIEDGSDQCPSTASSDSVDANGCSDAQLNESNNGGTLDSDGDGVADDQDMCADTPDGTAVGADGCPTTSLNPNQNPDNELNSSEEALVPPPDLINCQIVNPNVIISENKSTLMRCRLNPPAYITVWILKGDYTPPNDPDPAAVIKTLAYQKPVSETGFTYIWNGIDNYDAVVPEGDYTFLVKAQEDTTSKPDISMQKIKVMINAPVQTQEQTQQAAPPPPPPAPRPASPPPPPPPPPVPSRCPGVNYPKDIANHWAKDFINLGYDYCIFSGYSDGSFHPDGKISRAETVKATLVAAGIPPKLGCYDLDCGTPFVDLLAWQSPWLRAAWDNKIVKGVSATLFAPQRSITRGEAVVLISKAYHIAPHKGCYTPACGAGYPYNFFLDVTDPVQGSYLRALWDKGIIKGTGPNAFTPNRFLTRAEMATLLIKTGEVLGKIKAAAPQTSSTQTTSQSSSTTSSTQTSPTAGGSQTTTQTTNSSTSTGSTQITVQSSPNSPFGTQQSTSQQSSSQQ